MDVQLNIARFNREKIADHDYFLELIQTEGLDSFRKPAPEMEEASAALSKLFGQDVPAHSAVTVTMDSSDLELQDELALLAYYHGLTVFIGTTDILFNGTGIPTSSNGLSSIRNCMGTMWRQVSRPMLDRAFEDALRLPVSEQTWIQVVNYGSEERSYGLGMSMHVRASGQFELIWSSLPPYSKQGFDSSQDGGLRFDLGVRWTSRSVIPWKQPIRATTFRLTLSPPTGTYTKSHPSHCPLLWI